MRTGTGNVSKIKFYCETNNAHFQTLQAQPHSAESTAVITLPVNTGTLALTSQVGLLDHHATADSAAVLTVGGTGSLTGVSGAFTAGGAITGTQINIGNTGTGIMQGVENTTTATTQVAAISTAISGTGAMKLIVAAKKGSDRQISELLVTHDGTTAVATEYSMVMTNGILANYDVDINSGNLRFLITPTSATSTTFKTIVTLVEA